VRNRARDSFRLARLDARLLSAAGSCSFRPPRTRLAPFYSGRSVILVHNHPTATITFDHAKSHLIMLIYGLAHLLTTVVSRKVKAFIAGLGGKLRLFKPG
jgi:hypothetical protein